jgi:hypothetical protein
MRTLGDFPADLPRMVERTLWRRPNVQDASATLSEMAKKLAPSVSIAEVENPALGFCK